MSDQEDRERDRALAAKVDALPREIEPARDLWMGVEARIAVKKRAQRPSYVGTGATVGIVLLSAAAAWLVFFKQRPAPIATLHPVASVASVVPVTPPLPSAAPAVLVPEEASYVTALTALRAQVDSHAGKLPAANLKAIHVSLAALDAAIATTRASLVDHPDDADLRAELDAEYELEIQTLNDVLEWTTRT